MLTLVGHFVSSPREREKRDRRDSRGDEREEQGRKRNRNESEVPCPAVSQYQLDVPVRYIHYILATPDHPQSTVSSQTPLRIGMHSLHM